MNKHPFRVAIEEHYSEDEFRKLFSPNVVLYAPMLSLPVKGVDKVMAIVAQAAKSAGPIHYNYEVSDGRQTFLIWEGRAEGFKLEATTILIDGSDGLISEMRVLMRPWPVVTIFRNAMYVALSAHIPKEYWDLGPRSAPPENQRKFTPIALQPIPLAPDMVLHSPMLAKSVSGKAEVVEAVAIAHQVQTKSSYTSIIATPELLIELFDCDADGYPMEGMWIQKLNDRGEINELSVLLRPYPAVTVLRNNAKAIAESKNVLGPDYWELPLPK